MQKATKYRLFAGVMLLAMGMAAWGFNARPRVQERDLYRAKRLQVYVLTNDLAIERSGAPWKFSADGRCNFTYFSPEITNLAVNNQGLCFKTSGERVVLGWGNYDGRQAKAERISMYSGWNEVVLEVRQSAASSTWAVELWANGSSKIGRYGPESLYWWMKPKAEAVLEGNAWQTLRFKVYKAGPDGFGLTIAGPAENAVEIKSIRVEQLTSRGYYRKAFDLPRGGIWRAVGMVSEGSQLFVNGREVPLRTIYDQLVPVDLAPYLAPGKKNVICLYAEQVRTANDTPVVSLQGRVIMRDGTVVILDTGADWKGAALADEGWQRPDFDDAPWRPAMAANMDATFVARRWPSYDGRLLLENPGVDPRLYFDDAVPLRVNLRVPEGLAGEKTSAHWVLRRVERNADRPEVARGVVEQGERQRQTHSVVYPVDAGRRESGVYTLEVELRDGDTAVDHRIEEPLIVVGRLPMAEVAGNDYEEGMRMELEKVIDFTSPADPHRWVESAAPQTGVKINAVKTPRIVNQEKLVYREVTDAGRAAMFSYRFEFARPHGWYMLVLEYPNDAERWIGVSVTSAGRELGGRPLTPWRRLDASGWTSEDGPSLVTGGKYPLDGKLHEMRWLHWADPEIHTLDIVNLKANLPAAAARLRIYRVDELPAVKINTTGERLFGIHSERAHSLGRTFGDVDGLYPYQGRYDHMEYDQVARFVQRLRWHFDACRNYSQYLRFTGQNFYAMGAFQYAEDNNSYTPPDLMPGDGRLLQDIRETALRFFERNGITMYSMVEYVGHKKIKAQFAAGDTEVAAGAETVSFITKDGKQGGWHANPNHPAIEAGYRRVAADLAEKFAFSPAWKGIYYCVFIDGGGLGPAPCVSHKSPFDYDYSDATIAAFARDTRVQVPGDPTDPQRFAMRHLFLTSDAMREQWVAWRCRATRSYLTKTRDTLHKYRKDLNVLYGFHAGADMSRYWLFESDKPYGQYMREFGMDPSVVENDKNIWFGRYIYPVGPASDGKAYFWEHIVGAEPSAYYARGPNRMVTLCTCWHELPTGAPGWLFPGRSDSTSGGAGKIEDIPDGWPVPSNVSRFISQAHDDNVMEPFTQAMIGADPDILIYGFTDVNIINSREQHMREVAKIITALPKEKFASVLDTADFKHNLAMRALRKDGAYWFYVANPGYWPVSGEVVLSGPAKVIRPGDGAPVATREEDGKTIVPVSLKPFGMAAFRAAGAETPDLKSQKSIIAIIAWSNAPLPEADLAHMRTIIRDAGAIMDDPAAALAITRDDRDFMRAILAQAEALLAVGNYAAAWSALTNWRFWSLWKENLIPAQKYSARLPGRPGPADKIDTWERPTLAVAAVRDMPPAIDGQLDDAAWKGAPASYRFFSIGGGQTPYLGIPLADTSVQACHDGQNLYLGLRMADPDVKALRKVASADNPIEVLRKYDDTVVMFINAENARVRQFAVNAGGLKYYAGSGDWGVTSEDLRQTEWQAAAGAADGYWTIEAAIPFAAMEVSAPPAGAKWRANFIRRFRELLMPESYWARIKQGWSDVECYGELVFQ